MDNLHDLVATTTVAIEMAEDALELARQATQRLQSKRAQIQQLSTDTLNRYQLL